MKCRCQIFFGICCLQTMSQGASLTMINARRCWHGSYDSGPLSDSTTCYRRSPGAGAWLYIISRKANRTLSKQARDELHLSALGFNGLYWENAEAPKAALKHTRTWLHQKSLTIAGGTAEVQRNIIAKRVLGLPD